MLFALGASSISTAVMLTADDDEFEAVDDVAGDDVFVVDSICAFNCQFVWGTL